MRGSAWEGTSDILFITYFRDRTHSIYFDSKRGLRSNFVGSKVRWPTSLTKFRENRWLEVSDDWLVLSSLCSTSKSVKRGFIALMEGLFWLKSNLWVILRVSCCISIQSHVMGNIRSACLALYFVSCVMFYFALSFLAFKTALSFVAEWWKTLQL